MKSNVSLALVLASVSSFAYAQSNGQTAANGKPSAYGSASPSAYSQSAYPASTPSPAAPVRSSSQNAYQGVSQPSSEPILSNESQDVDTAPAAPVQSVAAPGVAATGVQAPAVTASKPAATTACQNPDAGIVEVPVTDGQTTATSPKLLLHSANPDAGIVTSVDESPNVLPQGTPLHARLLDDISADQVTAGTPFTAQLTRDVTHMGAVIFPVGSYVHGRVAYVNVGRRITGQSSMKLRPEEVVLPDGTHYFFRGIVTQTAGSETRANAEGEIVAKGHPIRTASEYGMTAGSGAVIGGVVAGPVGAVAGAGIGAGLMTVHVLRDRNVPVLNAGSMITFALSAPISLNTAPVSAAAVGTAVNAPSQPTQAAPAYVEPKIQN